MAKILVTGAAGFIGFHLSQRLLDRGEEVIGLDNLNDYYDVTLKTSRLEQLVKRPSFSFYRADLASQPDVQRVFAERRPQRVVNLAAQAGVRHSLRDPGAYVQSNLAGFVNVLEGCRNSEVEHLVYASSSSVYGANTKMPFSVHHNVDHPLSLYAASKKSNELMAHAYSALFQMPTTGLRFFTVYGPWGRPDMAMFIFTRSILKGQPIDVYNYGRMKRDFTYIDDIIEGIVRVLDKPSQPADWSGDNPDPAVSFAPYRIYNIGNNQPVELMHVIETIERCLGRKATIRLLPLQPGDVPATCADVDSLMQDVGFRPSTPIEAGIERFIAWYRSYYGVDSVPSNKAA